MWRSYVQLATIEKDVRELLYDYTLGKMPTHDWGVNVAFFPIVLFAYNLVNAFKRLCLAREYFYTMLDIIRTDFLMLPAKLTRQGNRSVLVLPRDYHHQAELKAALNKIEKLRAGYVNSFLAKFLQFASCAAEGLAIFKSWTTRNHTLMHF